jgi:hypothetical protein
MSTFDAAPGVEAAAAESRDDDLESEQATAAETANVTTQPR